MISVDWNEGGVKHLLLHRSASFVAKIRTMFLIFPVESARTEDPGPSFAREAAERGTKTKTATSCGNGFETNFLLASAESVRRNGNQHLFIYSLNTSSHGTCFSCLSYSLVVRYEILSIFIHLF